MSLIELVKFREMETGLYRIPRFKNSRFEMGVFEMGFELTCGLSLEKSHFINLFLIGDSSGRCCQNKNAVGALDLPLSDKSM